MGWGREGGGIFSKTAIAQGLAGHWSAGGEQWLLHHLWRDFCFDFLWPITFLCFVLPILSHIPLQGRGVRVREGLCGAELPTGVNPPHTLIHWPSNSVVESHWFGQVWFLLCQSMLTTPNYCLVLNVFGNLLRIICSIIFTDIQVELISL